MTDAAIKALANLALALSVALETVTDGDARAHLNEIEIHLTALMRSAYGEEK